MLNTILHLFIVGASKPVIVYIIIASVADIIMGLIKAGVGRRFNSTVSSAGVLKHVAMIIIPVLTSPLFDLISGGSAYWTAFTYLILITMIFSIVENWIAVGLPFPDSLKKYLDDEKTKLVKPQVEDTKGEANEKK